MPQNSVDALNVRIGVDISKLQTGLKRCTSKLTGLQTSANKSATSMQSSFNKVGSAAKKLATTLGAAFAINKIKDFSKSAIEAASDLAEVQNVVDTVFDNMSESINEWAKSAMSSFGLSETSAKKFTSTMGAMLKSSGITGKALETMSINMAALSADMASFYNLDAQTAFNKIRAGISGETEPLKQLGINMSVANMEAYALSQGITKSYNAMSQSEQMILRYNYLLSVTADAQHDFERTSSGWANQTRILAENFNRLKTIIGQGLIQALTPLINMFNTLITKVIQFAQAIAGAFGAGATDGGLSDAAGAAADTADGLKDADKAAKDLNNTIGGIDELNIISDNQNTNAVDNMAAALGALSPNSVYDTVGKAVDEISEKMTRFADKLKEKLMPVVELAKTLKKSFEEAFDNDWTNGMLDKLKTGFSTVLDIVGALASAFEKAWEANDSGLKFLQSIGTALNNIVDLANSVGAAIAEALNSTSGMEWMSSLIAKWQSLVNLISGIAEGLSKAWNDGGAGERFVESILQKWASVNNFIAKVRDTIAEVFKSEVGQAFFATILSLCTAWNTTVSMIYDTFSAVWENAGFGKSIIEGIVSSVTNLIGFVSDLVGRFQEAWAQNETGKKTVEAIGNAIDSIIALINHLSAAWREVWNNDTTTSIFTGILSTITTITNTVGQMADAIKSALASTGADTQIFTAIQSAIQGIVSAAQNMANHLQQAFSGINWAPIVESAANLASAISKVVQALAGLAGNVVAAFGEQLKNAFNSSLPALINGISNALQLLAGIINRINPTALLQLAEAFLAVKAAIAIAGVIQGVVSAFSSLTNVASGISGSMLQTVGVIVLVTTALTALAVAIADVINAWNTLTGSASSAASAMSNAVSNTSSVRALSTSSTSSVRALSTSSIPQAATGGIFSKGDLFIANERGPELIGSQNGQSAVMNNQQIVDAVSSGVADALSPLVDAMTGGQSEPKVTIRGSDLLLVMQRAQKQRGSIISNNFAFGGA